MQDYGLKKLLTPSRRHSSFGGPLTLLILVHDILHLSFRAKTKVYHKNIKLLFSATQSSLTALLPYCKNEIIQERRNLCEQYFSLPSLL